MTTAYILFSRPHGWKTWCIHMVDPSGKGPHIPAYTNSKCRDPHAKMNALKATAEREGNDTYVATVRLPE